MMIQSSRGQKCNFLNKKCKKSRKFCRRRQYRVAVVTCIYIETKFFNPSTPPAHHQHTTSTPPHQPPPPPPSPFPPTLCHLPPSQGGGELFLTYRKSCFWTLFWKSADREKRSIKHVCFGTTLFAEKTRVEVHI